MQPQASRVRDVFDRASEIETAAEREAFLDAACAGEPGLRDAVAALLRAHDRAGSFLARPAADHLMADTVDPAGGTLPDASEGLRLDFLLPPEVPGSLGRLGHYDVQTVLGRGGFGIVLRAFDTKLHRVVSIKVLGPRLTGDAAARRRFLREARAAAVVQNPRVVAVHAVEERPVPYLVMEYVAGQTLQRKMNSVGRLDPRTVLRIGAQVAEGLAAAHHLGLIHRDVKPANILLENGVERVKLTDFGLARAADDAAVTQSGVVAGTPQYMSPEQARGGKLDARSDLFSLGSVLYAMLTGKPPFRAATAMGVLRRVCDDAPQPVRVQNPDVPAWLEEVIARLLAKEPGGRFATAQELADLLAGKLAEAGGDSSLRPSPPPGGEGRPGRNRRVRAAAAVLLVAVGLGAAGWVGLGSRRIEGAASDPPGRPQAPQPSPLVAPFDNDRARAVQAAWAAHLGEPVETVNPLGVRLRLLPPGEFSLTPLYRVRLTRPFRIGATEVTVGQFRTFVGKTGYLTDAEKSGAGGAVMKRHWQKIARLDDRYETKPGHTWQTPAPPDEDHPVTQVSHQDAVAFCAWLGRRDGRTYRLPTEAEWVWACRAGTTTRFTFGNDLNQLGEYAWSEENADFRTHPVGRKRPNPWGLFDMHGNVTEHCADDWSRDLPAGTESDPFPKGGRLQKVHRGASFMNQAGGQANWRGHSTPTFAINTLGFRVVCEVPE